MRTLATTALLLVLSLVSPATGADDPAAGFLYGTVRTAAGDSVTGFLRWDGEEGFWDDLFHSRQREVPWGAFADLEALARERRQEYFRTHGLIDRIAYALENRGDDVSLRRLFIARFGDIAEIRISADEDVTVVLNDGSRHGVRGYSNDVSADITVHPAGGDPEEFDWDDLRRITFAPAPPGSGPYASRLYGRVTTDDGEHEGFIQWDRSECTSTDILDSDERDVALGEVTAIRRNPRGGSDVTFRDGTTATLTGSNDVDRGHRGVVVQTADRGRLVIPWDRFRSVTFLDGRGSGPGRDAYAGDGPLAGTVVTTGGERLQGRLVYDLDEARRGDLFDAESGALEVAIPFHLIARIAPEGDGSCRVTLRDGRELVCSGGNDTGAGHAGLLVFAAGSEEPRHVLWSDVREVLLAP